MAAALRVQLRRVNQRFRIVGGILVHAPTRRKLRRAVRVVKKVLVAFDLLQHPTKTFIGGVEKGFDWLGYRLSPDSLPLAARTVDNFVARMTRLYEHTSGRPDCAARRREYVRRWLRWATAGLGHRVVCLPGAPDSVFQKKNHVERVSRSSVLPV